MGPYFDLPTEAMTHSEALYLLSDDRYEPDFRIFLMESLFIFKSELLESEEYWRLAHLRALELHVGINIPMPEHLC